MVSKAVTLSKHLNGSLTKTVKIVRSIARILCTKWFACTVSLVSRSCTGALFLLSTRAQSANMKDLQVTEFSYMNSWIISVRRWMRWGGRCHTSRRRNTQPEKLSM